MRYIDIVKYIEAGCMYRSLDGARTEGKAPGKAEVPSHEKIFSMVERESSRS
jgi:hypothetical protein